MRKRLTLDLFRTHSQALPLSVNSAALVCSKIAGVPCLKSAKIGDKLAKGLFGPEVRKVPEGNCECAHVGSTTTTIILELRQEKRTQTQTFESGYFPVWWGSSPKVRYVPRSQGNQTFFAEYPGILPGYPGGARKV